MANMSHTIYRSKIWGVINKLQRHDAYETLKNLLSDVESFAMQNSELEILCPTTQAWGALEATSNMGQILRYQGLRQGTSAVDGYPTKDSMFHSAWACKRNGLSVTKLICFFITSHQPVSLQHPSKSFHCNASTVYIIFLSFPACKK